MRGFVAFNLGERFVGKSDSSLNLEIQTIVSRDACRQEVISKTWAPHRMETILPHSVGQCFSVSFPKIKAIYIYTYIYIYVYICVYIYRPEKLNAVL